VAIERIQTLVPGLAEQVAGAVKPTPAPDASAGSFNEMVSSLLESVNEAQNTAGQAQDALLNGEAVDLHEVMIKAEEAGISMDLLLEIRNKLVNGYNDLIRMPM
jgi:flagellar hook-basal body complex protein FliE